MRKVLVFVGHLVALLMIIIATFWLSSLLGILNNYPNGNDSTGQVFYVLQLAKFWPNIHWLHSWAGGMPVFIWYPILPYLFPALLVKIFSLSAPLLLVSEIVLVIALTGFAVYGIVWLFTRNWFISLASGILCIATPAMYNHAFSGGQYARNFGFVFFAATLWATFLYFQKLLEGQKARLTYGLIVIFAVLGTLSHFVTAIGIYPSVVLISLLQPLSLKERIYQIVKILMPALLLSAFYLIPSFVNPMYIDPTPTFWENNRQGIPSLSRLINLTNSFRSLNTLQPFLFIPAAILSMLVALFARKRLLESKNALRAILFFFLGILATLSYIRVIIPIYPLYLVNGAPYGSIIYFPILTAPLIGLLVATLFRPKWVVSIFGVLLAIGVIGWSVYYSAFRFSLVGPVKPRPIVNKVHESLLKKLISSDKQFNFRVGTGDEAAIASWFNIAFPLVPQTRHYFGSGVLNIDNYIYGFLSIWRWKDNWDETKFNLDWWAVKQFISTDSSLLKKFEVLPEEYKLVINEDGLIGYDNNQATPILLATDAPAVLVIGGENIAYDSIFRSLAQANLNSQYFIPIKGKSGFIDDYKENELKNFSIVFLYNYRLHNSKTAVSLLKKYAEDGGGVLIESNRYIDEEGIFKDLLPITNRNYTDFGKDWYLTKGSLGETVLADIDLTKFGPAIFDNQPWNMSITDSIDASSKIFISNYGKPLIMGKQVGKGKIIWSGMNLPYHIDTYKNREEARMLGKIFDWVGNIDRERLLSVSYPQENNFLTYEMDQFSVSFINPQKRKVVVKTNTKGVLFKEAFHKNWRSVLLIDGRHQSLSIYQAGPGMMYIPGPLSPGDQLTLSYQLSFWPHKVSIGISLITLILLLIYLFKGELPLNKRLSQWWAKEEE